MKSQSLFETLSFWRRHPAAAYSPAANLSPAPAKPALDIRGARLAATLAPRFAAVLCAGVIALSALVTPASGVTLFWDGDGSGTVGGDSGTWDTTLSRWSTSSAGSSYQAWVNGTNDDAVFQNLFGTVSITTSITVRTITFGATNYTFSGAGNITMGTSLGVIDTGAFNATISVPIVGSTGLSKNGLGLLTLTNTNTYTGTTLVNGGTLRINGSTAAGAVTAGAGATLGGSGTIGGTVTTSIGGKIDPGSSSSTISTLNVTGNFVWNGSSDGSATMLYEADTSGVSDKLVVTGSFNKGSGTTYIFDFRGGGGIGTYTLVSAAGLHNFVPADLGYLNLATGLTGTFITSDATKIRFQVRSDVAPTIAVSAPSVTAANVGPVTYTVTYTDDNFLSSDLEVADITLNRTGTANGVVSVDTSTGSTRTVTISGITGDGTIGISIAAATAVDTRGNSSAASAASATFSVGNTSLQITSSGPVNSGYGSVASYTITTSTVASLSVSGLPGGLGFNPATGIVSGIPQAVGTTNTVFTAIDIFGNQTTKIIAFTITPKAVSVSGLAVTPRAPNGTTLATLNFSNVILSGLVGIDLGTVTLNTASAIATFADANIGDNKPVQVTGLALTGVAAANYVLTIPVLMGSITGLPATVTLANLNQVFDGTPKQPTVTTVPAGLAVSVTYNGSTTVPSSVGVYSVLAIISDAQYGGSISGQLVISALGQAITFAALPDRSKTDPPFALDASASSGLPVSFTVSGPATLSGNTLTLTGSTGVVTVSANQPGNGNYGAAATVVRTFNVSDRPVPGLYLGSFTGDRSDAGFGLLLRPNNTARFAGFLPTLEIGLIQTVIAVDQSGNFSATFTPLGNTIVVTLRGRIAGNSITGNVDPFAITFSGTNAGAPVTALEDTGAVVADSPAAPRTAAQLQDFASPVPGIQAAAGVGGLYEMLVAGSTGTTKVSVFAGPDGRAYVFSTDGVRAAGVVTTVANDGSLSATLSDQSRLAITFGAGAGASGTLTPAGGTALRVVGGEDGLSGTQRIVNLSVLGRTRAGDETLVSGFSIRGTTPKRVLLRVAGPALTAFPSVSAPLANPSLQLYSGPSPSGFNDDWGNAPSSTIGALMASVSAFPFAPNSRDAALVATLAPGNYSVYALGGDGNVLTEIYELLESGEPPGAQRLGNISTRGLVGLGGDPLVAGFYVVGPLPTKVLIRGIGPALTTYGVTAPVIANPRLKLYRDQTLLKENDDWFRDPDAARISAAAAASGAFPLGAQSLEAAILIVLEPGSYSARIESVTGTAAIGMAEIYDVP